MDDLLEEIGKGFLRGIGYILAEIFFGMICYWVGWPICKIVTLGKYPSSTEVVYLDEYRTRDSGFWCSVVGLLVLVLLALYLMGGAL
ncbi:hypothetical protein [Halopseudomonas salegens]|uniref:Uncharacterized protein n=1 Tax=Halopseudomonas salegens TaxID=1434072 RepID=A0A1H2GPB7_9GAMM|nr:hypothetical protein [Halopseudomonas salegens]SDU21198.1 hypothetical protein SAMN05216210_2439 [Halopseudomonas salegens]